VSGWRSPWSVRAPSALQPPRASEYLAPRRNSRFKPLNRLSAVYLDAARRLDPSQDDFDRDINGHFEAARSRLGRFELDCLDDSDPQVLSRSWISAAETSDADRYERLCTFLFTVTKAKPYWNRMHPDRRSTWERTDDDFRDQLMLAVANKIATLKPEMHPVAGFLSWLLSRQHPTGIS